MRCRSCRHPDLSMFLDLGPTPNANKFRTVTDGATPELFMPLRLHRCPACGFVQIDDFGAADEFFDDRYAYFSSWSTSWLEHARIYATRMLAEGIVAPGSSVVEIASNDGYLLQWFARAGLDVTGVDPAANCAEAARRHHGIKTVVEFFGKSLAERLAATRQADLMIANNVLAHVPDPNDFVAGFRTLLAPGGLATFEFPHLLNLVRKRQFDTVYHEHFSYLSLKATSALFTRHGLVVTRVERLPTHGGSLRLFVRHAGASIEESVRETLDEERAAGLDDARTYLEFAEAVVVLKRRLMRLLIDIKDAGGRIAGYGAPAKGNTLLVTTGIGRDILDFTVDRSTWKQGLLLPGTGIPVLPPSAIDEHKPDYVLILPWNLVDEITGQLAHIRSWGGRFIVPIPDPMVLA